jgi:hypothetical protein
MSMNYFYWAVALCLMFFMHVNGQPMPGGVYNCPINTTVVSLSIPQIKLCKTNLCALASSQAYSLSTCQVTNTYKRQFSVDILISTAPNSCSCEVCSFRHPNILDKYLKFFSIKIGLLMQCERSNLHRS